MRLRRCRRRRRSTRRIVHPFDAGVGLTQNAVLRIWQASGSPPRQESGSSPRPQSIEKSMTWSAFYLTPPELSCRLCVTKKSQIQRWTGPAPILPILPHPGGATP